MDIIYRNMADFEKAVEAVVFGHNVWNGYTTCMWYNLITSKIILDKKGRRCALQEKIQDSLSAKAEEKYNRQQYEAAQRYAAML